MFVPVLAPSKRLCALGACVIANLVVHLLLVTLRVVLVLEHLRALIARDWSHIGHTRYNGGGGG